jgi:hypothetical protein
MIVQGTAALPNSVSSLDTMDTYPRFKNTKSSLYNPKGTFNVFPHAFQPMRPARFHVGVA